MKLINKAKNILFVFMILSLILLITYNRKKIFGLSTSVPPTLISGINFDESLNKRLQIEVLNGCGIKGIADLYTNFLRQNGYDVIDYKNAENFNYDKTTILIHKNNINPTHLKELMKIDLFYIKNFIDEDKFFDLTIIIGKDYKNLESYNEVSLHYEPFQ